MSASALLTKKQQCCIRNGIWLLDLTFSLHAPVDIVEHQHNGSPVPALVGAGSLRWQKPLKY